MRTSYNVFYNHKGQSLKIFKFGLQAFIIKYHILLVTGITLLFLLSPYCILFNKKDPLYDETLQRLPMSG